MTDLLLDHFKGYRWHPTELLALYSEYQLCEIRMGLRWEIFDSCFCCFSCCCHSSSSPCFFSLCVSENDRKFNLISTAGNLWQSGAEIRQVKISPASPIFLGNNKVVHYLWHWFWVMKSTPLWLFFGFPQKSRKFSPVTYLYRKKCFEFCAMQCRLDFELLKKVPKISRESDIVLTGKIKYFWLLSTLVFEFYYCYRARDYKISSAVRERDLRQIWFHMLKGFQKKTMWKHIFYRIDKWKSTEKVLTAKLHSKLGYSLPNTCHAPTNLPKRSV